MEVKSFSLPDFPAHPPCPVALCSPDLDSPSLQGGHCCSILLGSHWSRLCCCPQSPNTDDTGWGSWVSSETHLHASYPSPRALPTSKIFIPTRTFIFLFLEPVSLPLCFFPAPKSKITTHNQSSNWWYFLMSQQAQDNIEIWISKKFPRGNLNHKILDHWTWKFLAVLEQTKW